MPEVNADTAAPRVGGERPIRTVVFDLGGVLIDWDPRHLYRRLFDDEDEMERFLAEVATMEWNRQQDAGRPWLEAIADLVAAHPHHQARIEAYRERWLEMLAGPITESLAVLSDVRAAGLSVYALSNWSAETFPLARDAYPFLDSFDGVLISGEVGVVKPDPRIFELLIERFALVPQETVFVDDQPVNVTAASQLGFRALQFQDAAGLRRDLEALGALVASGPDRP